MLRDRLATPVRILQALILGPHPPDATHPDFLRVVAVNSVVLLSGSSGLAFALFNTLVIGTAEVIPLIAVDLAIFLAAVVIGGYLRRTGNIRRTALATSIASFATLLALVTLTGGGDYFVLWAMLYPPLAFMLHGIRAGALFALAFLLALNAMAILGRDEWNHGQLDLVGLSNLLGASLLLTAIVALYELARWQVQQSLARIQEDFRQASIHDGLTGLFNRRHFDEVLPNELARLSRDSRRLAILLLDVDRFKQYNDALGHPAGDRVLVRLAEALTALFRRAEDQVFRVGGEEFAILCRVSDEQDAARAAESVRAAVEALRLPTASGEPSHITVSVGVAVFAPGLRLGAEAAYAQADRALYSAKRQGRNRVGWLREDAG